MPLYVYQVIEADGGEGEVFEVLQEMAEPPLTQHPENGKPVQRILGTPSTMRSSLTNCQEFSASKRLMYPGAPFNTSNGSRPSEKIRAGTWCGLIPYRSASSAITELLPP